MASTARAVAPAMEPAPREEAHESEWWLLLTETQVQDIAAGYVPNSVKAMARTCLDWALEDQRRADRPVPGRKRKG